MPKINYWAVVVAALAAFLMSSLYYSPLLLGNVWLAVDPGSAAGTPGRCSERLFGPSLSPSWSRAL
jgi:hypothetical protein